MLLSFLAIVRREQELYERTGPYLEGILAEIDPAEGRAV
jgi:hypothetical protein